MINKIKSHSISVREKDTYDSVDRAQKEVTDDKLVIEHWEKRAERPSIQSVMSARHTLEENKEATRLLYETTFDFLRGYVQDKHVFELGYGVGRMTSQLASRAREVVGCDLSSKMYERAKEELQGLENVTLHVGKVTDIELQKKSFDLVFESIVLLHILNPEELRKTAEKMKYLSDRIFLVEHTYEGSNFPISKYSILRKVEEYEVLFKPYKLDKKEEHLCAGDKFTLMLFEK